jgi:NAD(P)-dependent dehydrogenase (short-subunit alcohol dehydrogenase family)
MVDLTERVALITGGAGGNGLGMANVLGECGAAIVIFDIDANLEEAVNGLRKKGFNALGFPVDITDVKQVSEGFRKALDVFGKIDILINNAGVARLAKFEEIADELRDLHFNVNIVICAFFAPKSVKCKR